MSRIMRIWLLCVMILLSAGLVPIAYLLAPLFAQTHTVTVQGSSGGASALILLTNSIVVGFLTTLLALVLGYLFGISAASIRGRAREVLVSALFVPLVIPSFVQAVAWIEVLNWGGSPPFTTHGLLSFLGLSTDVAAIFEAAWVMSLTSYPIIAWAVFIGRLRKSRELEDDARLHGDEASVLRHVSLPMIAPFVIVGGALVFF